MIISTICLFLNKFLHLTFLVVVQFFILKFCVLAEEVNLFGPKTQDTRKQTGDR